MYKKRPLKRTAHIAGLNAQNIAKRLRYVEQQSYRNRPEMRTVTLSLNAATSTGGTAMPADTISVGRPCQIAAGTAVNNRSGDRIRVYRMEIRGTCDAPVDHYIIQCKTSDVPTKDTFTQTYGSYILDSENTNRFTEWKHYRNPNANSNGDPVKFSMSWKGGIVVKYTGTGSTAVADNELIYCALNRQTASVANCGVSIRMWYTDA